MPDDGLCAALPVSAGEATKVGVEIAAVRTAPQFSQMSSVDATG